MRNITALQFLEFMQNAWLAGLDKREVCYVLIVLNDIEVTEKMELTLECFYQARERQFNSFIPTLHSELRGH